MHNWIKDNILENIDKTTTLVSDKEYINGFYDAKKIIKEIIKRL